MILPETKGRVVNKKSGIVHIKGIYQMYHRAHCGAESLLFIKAADDAPVTCNRCKQYIPENQDKRSKEDYNMYNLIWTDHDGRHNGSYNNYINLANKLLELARKEANNNCDTHVIAVIEGKGVDYEYVVDKINSTEKIVLQGRTMITNKLPDLNERIDVDCPVCGCDAGFIDNISVKINGKPVSLIHYECSECVRGFFVRNEE